MKFIKIKYRNRLSDGHLDNYIRMAATTYSPNIKKLVDDKKSVILIKISKSDKKMFLHL